jgi:hypothetical protein
MKRLTLIAAAAFACAPLHADSTWMLEKSEIAYHASHPFHNTVGKTTAAKGKGVCTAKGCDFLVAVPVNTFDSSDGNRDAHMIQAVNGGTYPMVSVRTHLASEPSGESFTADLTVLFGGKEMVYPGVVFKVSNKSADHFTATGEIPLILTNHNVKRPSLMGVAVKDKAPVSIETVWKK